MLKRNPKRRSLKVATKVSILISLKSSVLLLKRWDTLPKTTGRRRKETSKANIMHLLLQKKKNRERELGDPLVIEREENNII